MEFRGETLKTALLSKGFLLISHYKFCFVVSIFILFVFAVQNRQANPAFCWYAVNERRIEWCVVFFAPSHFLWWAVLHLRLHGQGLPHLSIIISLYYFAAITISFSVHMDLRIQDADLGWSFKLPFLFLHQPSVLQMIYFLYNIVKVTHLSHLFCLMSVSVILKQL